jgi:hypothetical protein
VNARQRQQWERMRECAELASSGAGHTPESLRQFRTALVRQAFRDDAKRHADLFDRIQSDNRPN